MRKQGATRTFDEGHFFDSRPTLNRAVANLLVSTVSLFVREGSSNIFQSIWFALLFGGPLVAISQDEMPVNSAHLPRPVTTKNFTALKSESPFLRSVGLSKSLVMTGIATIEDDLYATLIDLETKESFLVSEEANDGGLQLVAMDGDEDDLETLTAQIKIEGNQVVAIRYEQLSAKDLKRPSSGSSGSSGTKPLSSSQLLDAKKSAINYKAGTSSDGFADKPPAEIVQKLSRMSVQARENLNREMLQLRNKGLGSDARKKIYVKKVDDASRRR